VTKHFQRFFTYGNKLPVWPNDTYEVLIGFLFKYKYKGYFFDTFVTTIIEEYL